MHFGAAPTCRSVIYVIKRATRHNRQRANEPTNQWRHLLACQHGDEMRLDVTMDVALTCRFGTRHRKRNCACPAKWRHNIEALRWGETTIKCVWSAETMGHIWWCFTSIHVIEGETAHVLPRHIEALTWSFCSWRETECSHFIKLQSLVWWES